jgi:Immunoglobulin I-set domain
LEDTTVIENKNATFECDLNIKNVPVNWYVGGVEVVPGLKYQVLAENFSHCLSILSAKLEDAGEVKAAFRNVSTTCQLTVESTYVACFNNCFNRIASNTAR